MPAVDSYFDFRTPYSYLANTQLRSIGVESHWDACKNGQIRMRHFAKKREHVGLTGDGHTNVGAHFVLHYHVSLKGLISTLNDHAERGWFATCQASSAIAAGAMKKSSGLFLKRSRAQGTSITASMTI
jgi:hypothetical protein